MILEDIPLDDAILNMWDTEYEKSIEIGTSYPFEPLQKGECIVPSSWRDAFNVGIGDIIRVTSNG